MSQGIFGADVLVWVPCSIEDEHAEAVVIHSEIRWMGVDAAAKGYELRCVSGDHTGGWQIWWWEPSYWTGILRHQGGSEAETRAVFDLLCGSLGDPLYCGDGEDGHEDVGRGILSQAVSNRVASVREGLVPPIPMERPQP